ncbi:MAG: glycosyltransferase family 2 protein [Gammaproteobacteria bacterium]|nr:glycosyltransferase family 2 protein [Gammaproteobacteria bacterium]MCF6363174.1 glycosyltransferase family 2 protein [Gammaproteobacteria bacterium]
MTIQDTPTTRHLTLIIPVYNEADGLRRHLDEIFCQLEALPAFVSTDLLIVDDGSTDTTPGIVQALCAQRSDIALLVLNRNFGKEAAIMAGLDHTDADAVVVMDSDLQHPPVLLPKMVELWSSGVDVVEAVKISRNTRSGLYRYFANTFYRLFDALTGLGLHNHSDYKLLDRKVIEAYRSLPERTRFFRGLVNWMHFPAAQIPFEEPAREAGESKWGALRLLKLSWQSISSFTALPLQLVTLLGGVTFLISLLLGAKALYDKLSGQALDGFTTVILLLLIIGSVLMFSLGLLGSYVARIYDEIKARPHYLIDPGKSRLPATRKAK